MVNMQQFMKATSMPVADSHSTTEFVTQFLFMNMECKKKEHQSYKGEKTYILAFLTNKV